MYADTTFDHGDNIHNVVDDLESPALCTLTDTYYNTEKCEVNRCDKKLYLMMKHRKGF